MDDAHGLRAAAAAADKAIFRIETGLTEIARWLRSKGIDPERATAGQIAEALNATGCFDVFGDLGGTAETTAPGRVQVTPERLGAGSTLCGRPFTVAIEDTLREPPSEPG